MTFRTELRHEDRLMMNQRLGDPEALDAVTHGLERAIDGFRLVGHCLLGLVDLERDVHSAGEIEAIPQRDVPLGDFAEGAVGSGTPDCLVAREEEERRDDRKDGDSDHPPLQVGHVLREGGSICPGTF